MGNQSFPASHPNSLFVISPISVYFFFSALSLALHSPQTTVTKKTLSTLHSYRVSCFFPSLHHVFVILHIKTQSEPESGAILVPKTSEYQGETVLEMS